MFLSVCLLLCCLGMGIKLQAQTISSDVIGAAGTFGTSSQYTMAWTIGEVTIETFAGGNSFLTQGFHQPNFKDGIVRVDDFFIPQGFSPNGDGINDLFVIRGIDRYPNNSILIFNRWGNKIYECASYKSTWNGTSINGFGGNQLPAGTYFFLLDLGNGSSIIKGAIYLNR